MRVVGVYEPHYLERRDRATVISKLLYDDYVNELSFFVIVTDVSYKKQVFPKKHGPREAS